MSLSDQCGGAGLFLGRLNRWALEITLGATHGSTFFVISLKNLLSQSTEIQLRLQPKKPGSGRLRNNVYRMYSCCKAGEKKTFTAEDFQLFWRRR